MDFHIFLETSPCSLLTPLLEAAVRSASTVMQNSSASLAAFFRPSARNSPRPIPSRPM